jgi:putative hydrolase of the HAD superfamily
MRPSMWTDPKLILLDFFGTLVEYSASRTEQGYPRSYAMLREFGDEDVSYERFLAQWVVTSEGFDRRSDVDDREHSMTDIVTEFLHALLGRDLDANRVAAFTELYVAEWNTGVSYLDGLDRAVAELRANYRLAVVSNTHSPTLVPDHLRTMRVAQLLDAVVLSVDVGWRKPHPAIYHAALDQLGIAASDAVFVGDSYQADFAGPERVGIRAFLIDPRHTAAIPEQRRLDTILDLPARLAAATLSRMAPTQS